MQKILLLYASQTGVTADITSVLRDRLAADAPDKEYVLENVRDITPENLVEYRLVVFGNSTWDHGIPSPDGEEFLERLITAKPDLSTVTFALFGIGDTAYPEFCGALPLVKADLESCGGKVHPQQFTIDGYPNEATMAELTNWAKSFIAQV